MSEESRKGKMRRAVPKTIDLTAGEVRETAAAGEQVAADAIAAMSAAVETGMAGEPDLSAGTAEARATGTAAGHDDTPDAGPVKTGRSWRGLAAGIAFAAALAGAGMLYSAMRNRDAAVADNAEALAAIDVLAGRLAEVERKLGEIAASGTAGNEGLSTQALAALEARIAAVESRSAAPAENSALAAIERKTAAYEKTAAQSGERLAGLAARMDEIAARLEAVEKSDAGARSASLGLEEKAASARASVALALRSAFERGEPFAELLKSAEELAGKDEAFDALAVVSATGVATPAALRRDFAAHGGAIDAALSPTPEGLAARLLANARLLVRVRPEGPVEGNGPLAVLSRIEAALAAEDLAGALVQWEQLPDAAKQATAPWRRRAAERAEAAAKLTRALALLR
jgi:hypothetical protein